jgi:hypothetical protein
MDATSSVDITDDTEIHHWSKIRSIIEKSGIFLSEIGFSKYEVYEFVDREKLYETVYKEFLVINTSTDSKDHSDP